MRRMWRRKRGQRGARGEWRGKTGGQEEQAERREWGWTRRGDDSRRIGLARRTGFGLKDGSRRLSLCLSLPLTHTHTHTHIPYSYHCSFTLTIDILVTKSSDWEPPTTGSQMTQQDA
ncbi:hypothetical protein CKAH01_03367 [Colletotrichum kahawae]|uniref:Uncharacterized protein n=1 Tax=Colletotrichum kahawae TaxID=34407 RepID=A0AAD9YRC5_COLKA|nr:hypothetical protein CKAH01_03367 [Colletotrichum kahawae]